MVNFNLKKDSLFNEILNAEPEDSTLQKGANPDLYLEPKDEIKEPANEEAHRFFVSDEIPTKVKFYYSRTICSLCCLLAVFNTLISNISYTCLGFIR